MVIERSRRDFLKQASLLAAASGTILRSAQAADEKFVVADTAFGKVRGMDAEGIKTFKGIPYGANTAGKNRFMPPVIPPNGPECVTRWCSVRARRRPNLVFTVAHQMCPPRAKTAWC